MSRSRTNPPAKEILLQLKHLVSHLRWVRRSQDEEEEREHLLAEEYPAPNAQPLHCLSPPPQLEAGSSLTSGLDDATLTKQYAAMAQELLSFLPFPCRLLGPEDIKLVGKYPIAAGRFADLWEGTYNGTKTVLKSYRCYVSFDAARVIAVRYNRCFRCMRC